MREISLHILDLARNCIEAGATAVELAITEERGANQLRIRISDDGRGMDEATLGKVTDPFFTTRTTRRWGMGLPLFAATCERCAGGMAVRSAPGEGTTVEATLALDHWDRPPLGDMGAVIQSLACEADHVALRYRHVVRSPEGHEEVFELDTAELQDELGNIRLADPTVLYWLGQFVKGQLRRIGSCE